MIEIKNMNKKHNQGLLKQYIVNVSD